MSGWSAVGLADRNAVENLIEQIESLRRENRELFMENQRLLSAQLNEKIYELYAAENQNTQLFSAKIMEMQRNLSAQMEGISRLFYQQITTNGESVRDTIESAFSALSVQLREIGAHLEQAITVDGDSSRKAVLQLNKQMIEEFSPVLQKQTKANNEIIASLGELKKSSFDQNKDIKKQISSSLHQVFEQQQQLSTDSIRLIADANKDLVSRMEQYCTSALKEVKKTGERYKQMEHDEQESLDKIRALSSEMLELGEHQRKVMEQLSQLCQDSDQFMEIQKSMNDMWEIMKAVWVDSLLNDFDKEMNGQSGK